MYHSNFRSLWVHVCTEFVFAWFSRVSTHTSATSAWLRTPMTPHTDSNSMLVQVGEVSAFSMLYWAAFTHFTAPANQYSNRPLTYENRGPPFQFSCLPTIFIPPQVATVRWALKTLNYRLTDAMPKGPLRLADELAPNSLNSGRRGPGSFPGQGFSRRPQS